MAGPWEQYQSAPASDGPWAQFQPASAQPVATATAAVAPTPKGGFLERLLGAPRPEQQAAIADLKARPFGSGLPQAAYNAGGAVTDLASKYLSPAIAAIPGTLTNVGIQALPMILGGAKGLVSPTTEAQSAAALAGQRNQVLKAGQDLGLKVPPTQVNPGVVNRTLESVGGKAATAQQAAADNEAVIYGAGQRAAGLQPNQAINEETLAAATKTAAEPYRQVARLSAEAQSALEDWQTANQDAKLAWNEFNKMGRRTAFYDAKKAEGASIAAIDKIEKEADKLGNADLVQKLKAARVQIAKIKTVEDAMRGSSFNAQALARALDQGVPLSGELKTLAQFAQDFPKAVAPPQIGGSIGVSQLMPYAGGGLGGVVGALLGDAHGAGLGALGGMALGQALPPTARSLVLSPAYQSLMANIPQATNTAPLLRSLMLSPASQGALYRR